MVYQPRCAIFIAGGICGQRISLARSIRSQPLAKCDIQSFALSFRDLAGSFDKVFIGAKK
jgi:hypothetical protein